MRNLAPIVMTAFLTGAAPYASAQSTGSNPLSELSNRFMEGYETHDTVQVIDQILAALKSVNPQSSPFLPSAQIRPLTVAILAFETSEGERDRVRCRISYGIEQLTDQPNNFPYPVSFIQVDRFSLGSAIHQGLIESSEGEHIAPPEAFDVGPHVSWRLITRPVQGTKSDIVAAGRTELSETQAQGMTCLGPPCLSPVVDLENAAHWSVEEKKPHADPVPFQHERAGLLPPTAAIDQLTRESDFGEVGRFRAPSDLPDPFLEPVIEINLAQDSALDAGMRQAGLMDDSFAVIWQRLIVIRMGKNARMPTAYRADAYECRRGRQFPPGGGFCP